MGDLARIRGAVAFCCSVLFSQKSREAWQTTLYHPVMLSPTGRAVACTLCVLHALARFAAMPNNPSFWACTHAACAAVLAAVLLEQA